MRFQVATRSAGVIVIDAASSKPADIAAALSRKFGRTVEFDSAVAVGSGTERPPARRSAAAGGSEGRRPSTGGESSADRVARLAGRRQQ